MPGRRYDVRSSRPYRKARLAALERDAHACRYCGGYANEADHVVPVVRGGHPTNLANLVASCRRCNRSKGSGSRPKGVERRSGSVFSPRGVNTGTFDAKHTPRVRQGPITGDYSRRTA